MGRRDDLVGLLDEFLSRIAQSGDFTQAFAPSVVAVAADLVTSLDETDGVDIPARYRLGWLKWFQAQTLLGEQRDIAAAEALELLSPAAAMIGRLDFPEPLLPALADLAQPPLVAALQQASHTQDLGLLTDVITGYQHSVNATPAGNPDLARRLSFLGAATFLRFRLTGDRTDLDHALVAARRAVELGAPDPDFDKYLSNLCAILLDRYEETGDTAELDEAITVGRDAVTAAVGRDDVAEQLTNLSGALLNRFSLSTDPRDLAEATDAARRAVASTHTVDSDQPSTLNNLALALYRGFTHGGPATDLDEAVDLARRAVQHGAGQAQERMFLTTLTDALHSRFELNRSATDLDDAITAGRRLVSIIRGGARSRDLILLATDLLARFSRTRNLADLDEAVAMSRRAVEVTRPESRLLALRVLDQVVSVRFDVSDAPDDEDEAIATRQAIVAATPVDEPERSARLSHLGLALLNRFRTRTDPRDLDRALEFLRAAVSAATSDADRLYCQSDLCVALFARYQSRDTHSDLDEAARIARRVATSTPDAPAGVLLNLALVLGQRARMATVLDDLDLAIDLVRRTTATISADAPPVIDRPGGYLVMRADGIFSDDAQREPTLTEVLELLSGYLHRRFEWTNVLADVDESVEVRRRLVAMSSDGDDARRLAALNLALRARWGEARREQDLDDAVESGRRALARDPANPGLIVSLSDTLKQRFSHRGVEGDLDEAIELGRRAIQLGSDAKGGQSPDAWANLSDLLRRRFTLHRYVTDIDEAVDAGRHAVEASSDDAWRRPMWILILARALFARILQADHRGVGDQIGPVTDIDADRAEALNVLTTVVDLPTAAPRVRVECAQSGAWLAINDWPPGPDDLVLGSRLAETAVRLLPELAPRRMARLQQHRAIGSLSGIAEDAAALALIAPDRPLAQRTERALSLLEGGRAVLLGQLLETRGDLTELRRARPELAARFAALRDLLDHEPSPGSDDEGKARIGAATELTATLREIRQLDGFATFALPPTADELRTEADQGPIVMINPAYHGGNAIILTKDGSTALSLPNLTAPAVVDQINVFQAALRKADDLTADRVAAQHVLLDTLQWLWDNVTGPVLDALGYQETPAGGAPWPRLWWAPDGYLSLLPLHAAGYHDNGPTVLDRVVSSYTPTIRSLRHARDRQTSAPNAPNRALIVAMPVTPGLPELPNVRAETELLTRILPHPDILTTPGRKQVLAELPRHSIAHFACHGTYDVDNPANSRLLLRDHERDPLTVGDLSAINLDGAQLAYLSACHTAMNSAGRLLDEAMHLAGALQAAGFSQVVGTLWTLDDEVALEVTEDFYHGLRTHGTDTIDPTRAAYSLHHATRALRDEYPGTPSLWASHLHFGA